MVLDAGRGYLLGSLGFSWVLLGTELQRELGGYPICAEPEGSQYWIRWHKELREVRERGHFPREEVQIFK